MTVADILREEKRLWVRHDPKKGMRSPVPGRFGRETGKKEVEIPLPKKGAAIHLSKVPFLPLTFRREGGGEKGVSTVKK